MKAAKLPGDILKIMRTVDKQPMSVNIDGMVIKMSRKQYDELMKCNLFFFNSKGQAEGDTPPSGFYLVDEKAKTATFKWLCPLKPSHVEIKVEGRSFKVEQPYIGYTYG